jgi:putative two-component system response regulator
LVEHREGVTGHHIEKAMHYLGILLGAMKKMGVYKQEVSTWDTGLLLQSSQLHDIGKIAIKDSILQKPGILTPEEFEQIKKHTTIGADIISKIEEDATERKFLKYAKAFAATHHERWDGSGYPIGLAGENIPLLGRMMSIVDVYDALVSVRPYKEALTKEKAVQIILDGKGTQFDPLLLDVFLSVLDEF